MSSKTNSKKFVYKEGVTKKHEVLKEAMKYLSPTIKEVATSRSNKFQYICQCINKVVNGHPLEFVDHSGLTTEVERRINYCLTFEEWLARKHKISYEEQQANKGRKLQYTRLCWMGSLYEEFLAKDE